MATWTYPVVLAAAASTVLGVSYSQALYVPAGRSIWGAATLVAGAAGMAGYAYSKVLYVPVGRSIWGAATPVASGMVGEVLWASRFGAVLGLFRTIPYYYWGAP